MRATCAEICRVLPLALVPLIGAAGCGNGLHPVRGKVTFDDGKPLARGIVVFESKEAERKVTARGEIQEDGTYELGTRQPGDGAPAGAYRVLIAPQEDIDAPAPERQVTFDSRYRDFKTSGLEFEVKAGTNEFPIRLTRAARARR
jgi:hypothetical protein